MPVPIEISVVNTDNDLKLRFTSPDNNFSLGPEYACFDEHTSPKLNFAGVGLGPNGETVVINITSGYSLIFIGKAAVDLSGIEEAVTSIAGTSITGTTLLECNRQLLDLIKQAINWA
jgi:hypothetical protein